MATITKNENKFMSEDYKVDSFYDEDDNKKEIEKVLGTIKAEFEKLKDLSNTGSNDVERLEHKNVTLSEEIFSLKDDLSEKEKAIANHVKALTAKKKAMDNLNTQISEVKKEDNYLKEVLTEKENMKVNQGSQKTLGLTEDMKDVRGEKREEEREEGATDMLKPYVSD